MPCCRPHGYAFALSRSFKAFALLFTLLSFFTIASQARAAEQTITLQDHLNRSWPNQLLSYPFSAPEGACIPTSLELKGPRGPLSAQLTDIAYWPDNKTVKTARLWFIADLAPLAKDTYTLSYSTTPAAKPQTDLKVSLINSMGSNFFQISNNQLTLAVNDFESFNPPDSPPIPPQSDTSFLYFHFSKDRLLFCRTNFFGGAKIISASTQLIDNGPVLASTLTTLTYENNVTLKIKITLAAGDSLFGIEESVENGDLPDSGWDLLLETPETKLTATGFNKGKSAIPGIPAGKSGTLILANEPANTPILSLQPWQDWWLQRAMVTWDMGFKFYDDRPPTTLTIKAFNPGAWVTPVASGQFGDMGLAARKFIHLQRTPQGQTYLRCNAASGQRSWLLGASGPALNHKLNTVKDYILDWPLSPDPDFHPRLYLTKADITKLLKSDKPIDTAKLAKEITQGSSWRGEPHPFADSAAVTAYLLSGMDKQVAAQTRLIDRIENPLNIVVQSDLPPMAHKLGGEKAVDLFRDPSSLTALYDIIMAGDLVPAPRRKLIRARMAYLAYLLNEPAVWSAERGYRTGNVNMSVGYATNIGLLACLLADHPMALTWLNPAVKNSELTYPPLEEFLSKVGPTGEFPESVSNYLHVTATPLFSFAIALRGAAFKASDGTPFHDYVADPRMVRLMRYAAAQFTPPDPRRGNIAVRPASGRGNALHTEGLAGLVAKATAASDPDLSQEMQWYWLRTGPSYELTHSTLDGLQDFYMDPALPAKPPAQASQLFKDTGVLFKHGLGTKQEYFLNLLMITGRRYVDWYVSESGGFPAIFARGVPISVRFSGGYAEREELLISRVLPARGSDDATRRSTFYHATATPDSDKHGGILAFSTLPRQDYAAVTTTIGKAIGAPTGLQTFKLPAWPTSIGKTPGPITWTRQILFIKDPNPAGANYFLFRDTVSENQPTMWQFWTLSQRIGATKETTPQNLNAFLQDAPGNVSSPARELFGDNLTAVGQFGVDTDFFIASPQARADTPRHTLRWGTTYAHFGNMPEFQDLLHIQMPGKGAYYIVVFPRDRAATPAAFQRLADGGIIKVTGAHGTDYLYASEPKQSVTDAAANITFDASAASIQERAGQTALSLAGPGLIQFKGITFESSGPATLLISDTSTTIATPQDQPKQTITLTLPSKPKQTLTTTQSQTDIP